MGKFFPAVSTLQVAYGDMTLTGDVLHSTFGHMQSILAWSSWLLKGIIVSVTFSKIIMIGHTDLVVKIMWS